MPRGQGWPSPGRRRLTVRFGEPLRPGADESPRDFAPRIRDAVAALLDEDQSTWWEARRRAAAGATPDPSGPGTAQWRRVWEQTATITAPEPRPGGSGRTRMPGDDMDYRPQDPRPARPPPSLPQLTGVERHDVALVLGSGWLPAVDALGQATAEIDTTDLPGFHAAGVVGHSGKIRSIARR